MQRYASFRSNLHMKSPYLRISINDCRLFILKWCWGMCWFRFFKLMTGLFPPSFFFTRNKLLTNWLFAQTFFLWTFSIGTFSRDFQFPSPLQIFLLDWDKFPLAAAVAGVEEKKRIWYSFTISKILWSFVRNCHVFTKCFSLPAIWTFRNWPDKNNLFTSLWAYGNFSPGIRVGTSLKKVVFIWIFTIVLVAPIEVPALLLAVVFVRTFPSTMLFAWREVFPKELVSTCSVFKNSTCQQFLRLFVSLNCFWYLLTKHFARKIFLSFLE